MTNDGPNDEGFALVFVLGFLLLVAAILTPFTISSRLRGLTATSAFEERRLSLAANAVNWSLATHFSGSDSRYTSLSGREACQIGSVLVAISFQEQHALVDLNYASDPLLIAGLAAVGIDPADAESVAEAIRTFRSPSGPIQTRQLAGVELENGYKSGPFEDVVELLEIPELRKIDLNAIHNVFTVHSRSGQVTKRNIDPALASRMKAQGLAPLENTGAHKPITRFKTLIRTPNGLGNSDAIFQLGGQTPELIVSSKIRMSMPNETFNATCRGAFWPTIRKLISKGLGA